MPTMPDVSPPDKVKSPRASLFSNPELCVRIPALCVGVAYAAFASAPDSVESSLSSCLTEAALLGALSAWFFNLTLAPWMGWWRRALRSQAIVLAAPLLVAILMVWNLALPSLPGLAASDPQATLCALLDALLSNLSLVDVGTVGALGLLGCLIARFVHSKSASVTPLRGYRWRCLLGLGVIAMISALVWEIAPVVKDGYRLDNELERRMTSHLYDNEADIPDTVLPKEFRDNPEVRDTLIRSRKSSGPTDWSTTQRAWLAAMRKKGEQKEYWRDTEALALARFAERYFYQESEEIDIRELANLLEIKLWSDLVLLDTNPFRADLLARLSSNADEPASTWERLLAIASTRKGLDQAPPVDLDSETHRFVRQAMSGQPRERDPCDKRSAGFFKAWQSRRSTNLAWRSFLAQVHPSSGPVLAPADAERLLSSKTSSDLDLLFRVDARHELLAAIIVMDWQRQRALDKPASRNLSPEIAPLVAPYRDWFKLRFDRVEAEVAVRSLWDPTSEKRDTVYRVFQAPVFPVSAARSFPVTQADMEYGTAQVEQMMADRPAMKQVVKRGDIIYEWAARHFAGASCGMRVRWRDAPVPLPAEACNGFDGKRKIAEIRIRSERLEGGRLSGQELWACAVFELINIGNGPMWDSDADAVYSARMNRDRFINGGAKLEYLTCAKQARFYRTLWKSHLASIGQLPEARGHWWQAPPESFAAWQALIYGHRGYPDVPFREQFDHIVMVARYNREVAKYNRGVAEEWARYESEVAAYKKKWIEDRPPLPPDPYPVSDVEVTFGRSQVDRLLKDRPAMAGLLDDGAPMYDWLAKQFAGSGCGYRLHWSPEMVEEKAELRERIFVPALGHGGKPIDPQEAWALLVSQLYDARNDAERSALHSARKQRKLSEGSLQLALARLEHKTKLGLKAFFYRYWYFALTDRGITPEERYWALDTPNKFDAGGTSDRSSRKSPVKQPKKPAPSRSRPWSNDGSDDPALSVHRR